MPTPISHISDTARWVAGYRAMETARPDALFRDPYAARLAGERGQAIIDALPQGRKQSWPMVIRTAVMDEIIVDMVRNRGVDLVLNLAAGLDARPWRLPLPPALVWVDVDLPEILDYKREVIGDDRPAPRYQARTADLRDGTERRALFQQAGTLGTRAMVITEGLLIYLTAEDAAALAADLHTEPAFQWWLTDLASPRLLTMLAKTWGPAVKEGNAPFQFGPAEGTAFFAPFGWNEATARSTLDEALRLHRTPGVAWLWRLGLTLTPRARRDQVRRMSQIVLLERGEAGTRGSGEEGPTPPPGGGRMAQS